MSSNDSRKNLTPRSAAAESRSQSYRSAGSSSFPKPCHLHSGGIFLVYLASRVSSRLSLQFLARIEFRFCYARHPADHRQRLLSMLSLLLRKFFKQSTICFAKNGILPNNGGIILQFILFLLANASISCSLVVISPRENHWQT